MSLMGAGCKLMDDAGLKEVWSIVYKENSIPKMMEGKAYSRCLTACLLTDTALHFLLLSGNDHSHIETSRSFEPSPTFDKEDNVIDSDGNMFDTFKIDEEFVGDIDFEDNSDTASRLMERLKAKRDDNNGLMLFNEETVDVLKDLYKSLQNNKKNQVITR